jgi:hypothetical protein
MKVLTREELIKSNPVLQALVEGNDEMYFILKGMEDAALRNRAIEDVANQILMDELLIKIEKEEEVKLLASFQ